MAVDRTNLILMNQTHSNKVVEINKHNYRKKINADAMITQIKDLAIGVVTADCVPIIIYDIEKIIGCVIRMEGYFRLIDNTIKIRLNFKSKIYARRTL